MAHATFRAGTHRAGYNSVLRLFRNHIHILMFDRAEEPRAYAAWRRD
jgi:hypothetical protein